MYWMYDLTMANLDRLISEAIIFVLVLALELYTIKPMVGDVIGYILIGVTMIMLLLDILRNTL
jgi:hypothetical protein